MTIPGIIFYSIVFIFLIHRIIRNKTQLTVTELSLAFIFKVVMGCLYGYIYEHFYNGDDTWIKTFRWKNCSSYTAIPLNLLPSWARPDHLPG
jgi:hypothetical protein